MKCLFICLFVIFISLFRCLLRTFAHFYLGYVFSTCWNLRVLCVFQVFYPTCLLQSFLTSCDLSFHSFNNVFCGAEKFNFFEVHIIIVYFWIILLIWYIRNLCLIQDHKNIFLFSSKMFIVLVFIYKSRVIIELNFLFGSSTTVQKNLHWFAINFCLKSVFYIYKSSFLTLYPVPFICLSI